LFNLSEATVAFTDDTLQGAVNDWISNQDEATAMYGDINSWDVSAVTNMNGMFAEATAFNQDISAWDVSSVTTMSHMFYFASTFNQNISAWNVSKVTNMYAMFAIASAFNQNISAWDVSKVTSMTFMFYQAVAFNQTLCAWGGKLPAGVVTLRMFEGSSSCPTKDNPSFDSTPPGPFCYSCPISSRPTSGP
jgi:surface protein